MTADRLPTYFISHGGGPWPWMKEQMGGVYDRLEAALARMPADIGRTPRAVLMRPRFSLWVNRTVGAIFVAFGAALLALRRQAA